MRYGSADYLDDLMDTDPSMPSNNPIFRGAAFQQQQTSGPTYDDPYDDRVTFIGDAEDPTVQYHRSMQLPADLFSTGDSVDGGVIFGPVEQSGKPNSMHFGMGASGAVGAAQQSPNDGAWYATLRPHAGYPLPVVPDEVYAEVTTDVVAADVYGATDPLLVAPGVRLLEEKPLDMPSRLSMQPSSEQEPYKDFDTILGQTSWSGMKRAIERPIADSGPFYEEVLTGRIPSPTGAGGSMVQPYSYDLYPQPMTFRAPPVPWDQGVNADNGYYVDGGS